MLSSINYNPTMIVIKNDNNRSIARSIPVSTFSPINEKYAPNFSINTFDISSKGEIEFSQSLKHVKLKVILKGLNRSIQLSEMIDHNNFILGNNVVSEIRDNSATPRIAIYNETNINSHLYYLSHRSAGKFGRGNVQNTHINLLFGICLFDNESVYVVNRDKKKYRFMDMKNLSLNEIKVSDIIIDKEWTLYETELITRLSRCIADTAALLSKQTTITIRYNIPRVEYYCYLLQNFEFGNISKECLQHYFDAVDRRHERVAKSSIRLIQNLLKPLSVDIMPANTFGYLESFIRHHVCHGKMPSIHDAMALLAKKYPLWNEVLRHYLPTNFVDLARLSYAYEYIAAGKSVCKIDDTLCLAVEAYHEARILDHAESFIKKAQPHSVYVHTIYPMRQVALYLENDNTVAVDLYKNRPQPYMQDADGNAFDLKAEFLKLFN